MLSDTRRETLAEQYEEEIAGMTRDEADTFLELMYQQQLDDYDSRRRKQNEDEEADEADDE